MLNAIGEEKNIMSEQKIEKVLSYRSDIGDNFYAVKGKNIVMLGMEAPDDLVEADAANGQGSNGKYALVVYRGFDNVELQMLDDGISTQQAQEKALDLIDDNKNNVTRISVVEGTNQMFAGRDVYKTVASYAYIGKDEEGWKELSFEEVEKARGSTSVQSILFPTSQYSVGQAKTWLNSHGKNSGKVDTTENYHRFRQFDPSQCSSTPKTITMGKGIKAIICVKKADGIAKDDVAATAEEIKMDHEVEIRMADFEKGLVYGIVYSPDVKDSHGDWTTADEIEKAAHNFLPTAKSDWTNKNHGSDSIPDVDVVESYIAPCNFAINGEQVTKGSWVIVSRVNNADLRKSIQDGEVTGYSLEGTARKL